MLETLDCSDWLNRCRAGCMFISWPYGLRGIIGWGKTSNFRIYFMDEHSAFCLFRRDFIDMVVYDFYYFILGFS